MATRMPANTATQLPYDIKFDRLYNLFGHYRARYVSGGRAAVISRAFSRNKWCPGAGLDALVKNQ